MYKLSAVMFGLIIYAQSKMCSLKKGNSMRCVEAAGVGDTTDMCYTATEIRRGHSTGGYTTAGDLAFPAVAVLCQSSVGDREDAPNIVENGSISK
jgi:hypothetical protein